MQPPANDLEPTAVLSDKLAASREQFGSSCPKLAADLTANLKHRMLKENGLKMCVKNVTGNETCITCTGGLFIFTLLALRTVIRTLSRYIYI